MGKRLRLSRWIDGKEPSPWLTVVGVVSNIVQDDRTRQTFDPLVYIPFVQHPGGGFFAFVRTVAPGSLAAAVGREVYAMDPDLPVSNVMPLAERLGRAYGFERNVTVLFLFFALVALLVASVGLYAAVSHSVSRRVQEIGIRVALGATSRDILEIVIRQGILPVAAGLAIGLAVSFAMNRCTEVSAGRGFTRRSGRACGRVRRARRDCGAWLLDTGAPRDTRRPRCRFET